MDKPVSYELAKLLKEKGFNLKVVNFYNYEKLSLISDKDRQVEGLVNYNPINWNFVKEHFTSAPSIAEVVMWLYEKHGIWIEVTTDVNGKFCWLVKQFRASNNNFNSPTEAYEAAIDYTLKNLLL